MNYLNIAFKLAKFHQKSKKKYEKIINNSKEAFPSFLSTRHFYKRRKALFLNNTKVNNIKLININSAKQKDTKIILSKLASKRNSKEGKTSTSKINDSFSSINFYLDSDNNILNKKKNMKKNKTQKESLYNSSLSVDNTKNKFRKKELTPEDKMKLKSIISNFQKNQLTTNNLIKQEEKLSLNDLTESNFLFLLTNCKNKVSNKNRMKQLLYNKTNIDKIPKSSLLSFKMMKNFNKKTKKIYNEVKLEGIQFSNNINHFRKQIINAYKDKFTKYDLSNGKLNYDNAIKYLNSNQEKQILKALELEKEFYKTKYNENEFTSKKRDFMDNYIERKSKRVSTKKYEVNSFPSKNNKNNKLSFSKEKENQKEEEKIFDYNHNNKGISSHSNSKKSSLVHQIKNDSNESNNNINNLGRYTTNNLYLNYIKNIRQKANKIKSFNNSAKEEYNKYVKKTIKERSKQLADSLASLNSYFEYQPLNYINSDIPEANINPINLRRIIKVKSINKNLFSYDDDDLLLYNVKKLKEELRDIELKFYVCDKLNKKYHLSFLKDNVKRTTLSKINSIKNPRFGIPC